MPKKLLRQWKTLFLQQHRIESKTDIEIDTDSIKEIPEPERKDLNMVESTLVDENMDSIRILDEEEFADYLDCKGDWEMSAETYNFYNSRRAEKMKQGMVPLGKLIDTVFDMIAIPEPPHDIMQLPVIPLRLAIIGKPFSGKSTLAHEIAARYGLNLINVDDLVTTAISEFNKSGEGEALKKAPISAGKKLPRLSHLGAKIQMSLLEGQSPIDQHIVQLVLIALAKQVESEKEKPGNGWILLNFPRNRAQAQLFEKELSGYEDPKPIKLGNLKRVPKEEKKDKASVVSGRKRSLVAPADAKNERQQSLAKSGIDIVFMLEVDNEIAIKRAAGKKVDPVTGEKYHVEFSSPPNNVPGVNERLSGTIDDGNSIEQLQLQITAFEEQDELMRDWFSRFGNMTTVDTSESVESIISHVSVLVQELLSRKEREEREKTEKETAAQNQAVAEQKSEDLVESNSQLALKDDKPVESPDTKKPSTNDEKKAKPPSGKRGERAQSGGKIRRVSSQGDNRVVQKLGEFLSSCFRG